MPLSLNEKQFIINVHTSSSRRVSSATELFRTEYGYRVSPETIRRVWRDNELQIDSSYKGAGRRKNLHRANGDPRNLDKYFKNMSTKNLPRAIEEDYEQ